METFRGKGRILRMGKKSLKESIAELFVDVWNVPNVLTMLRILLIPVFVVLHARGLSKWALAVFLLASFTDFLDGYLARKNNQITAFGKLMDPLADKVMVCTALLCQAIGGAIPWVAFGVVLGKELLMVLGGVVMLRRGVVVYSNMWGKVAQCMFILALVMSFFHEEFLTWGVPLDSIVLWASVALTLVAMLIYAVQAAKQLGNK